MKLVLLEAESMPLVAFIQDTSRHVSCNLARTEVIRAVRPHGAVGRARAQLERMSLILLDDAILNAAADLDPAILRSLDAIHLAAALSIADDLDAFVTYDRRQAEAARILGLPVASPGAG